MLADKRRGRRNGKTRFFEQIARFRERVVIVAVSVYGQRDGARAVPRKPPQKGHEQRRHSAAVYGRAEYEDVVLPERVSPHARRKRRDIRDARFAQHPFEKNFPDRAHDLFRRVCRAEIHEREPHIVPRIWFPKIFYHEKSVL